MTVTAMFAFEPSAGGLGTPDTRGVQGIGPLLLNTVGQESVPHEQVAEPTEAEPGGPIDEAEVIELSHTDRNTGQGTSEDTTQNEGVVSQIARDLYLACRQRGFPVQEPDNENIVVGPTLLSVPMALQAGAQIRRMEAAVEDLAREVGVADVTVENYPDRANLVVC